MSHTTGQVESHTETNPGVAAIALAGGIDTRTTVLLSQAVTRALAHHPRRLVIDLTGVRFLSTTGVSALIQARAIADAQSCVLYLQGARPNILMVLSTSGVSELFPLI